LAATSTLPLLVAIFVLMFSALSYALPLQALPSSDDGVSAKWSEVGRRGEVGRREVGRREVGRREKLWGRKEAEKTKNLRQGRMCFWFIPKTAWMASSSTDALVAASSL
jgi:hypothetical protein